jgi:HlyD family secretion protein
MNDSLGQHNGYRFQTQVLTDANQGTTVMEQGPMADFPAIPHPFTSPDLERYGTLSSEASATEWSSLTQDLVDTLPRAWTRGLLYLLVGFAGTVLPWAMVAKVDQTGMARGRLEPEGKTYELDSSVSAAVVSVGVKEGDTVNIGQPLVELDSDLVKIDLQQAQTKLEGQLNRLTQLQQMRNQIAIAARTQQLQIQAQVSQQQAQITQVKQQLNASQEAYALAQDQLSRDLNEVQRYRDLWQEGVVPQIKVVELERIANESQRQLDQVQADIAQSQAELVKQQRSYDGVVHTGSLNILDNQKQAEELQAQISDLQAEIAQTKETIKSLHVQIQQRIIYSPVAGTVFELPIEKPGAVVQPGQMVAQIAPKGAPLVFRAQIPSSESGFLRVGMPVKLKFDAYPFQDYGIVAAHISWIAPNSTITQTAQGDVETFELEITLEQHCIPAHDQCVELTPGQSATAEVIVRQRRIIDFVLDPFKKLQQGDFKL